MFFLVFQEIEDRKAFLDEMEALGQGKKYRPIITTEISQVNNLLHYYSFKIFPCFWLVKTSCIIHHNQLVLTKFGKNFVILNQWCQKFCHYDIEPMTSKRRQKVIEPLTEKTWEQGWAAKAKLRRRKMYWYPEPKSKWEVRVNGMGMQDLHAFTSSSVVIKILWQTSSLGTLFLKCCAHKEQ